MIQNMARCQYIFTGKMGRFHHTLKVEAYDATKRRKKSKGAVNLVELPSEVPLSVDGVLLDLGPETSQTLGVELKKRLKRVKQINISYFSLFSIDVVRY